MFLIPHVSAASVTVTPTQTSQVVSELSSAVYTISLTTPAFPNPANPDKYSLSLSGLPSGAVFAFGSNPVAIPAAGVTVTLTIDVASSALCPGTYSLSVTATDTGPGSDSGSATFSLTVTPAGPPLQLAVSTDKSTYRLGDTITILMNTNKPAYTRLTISPPSGAPSIFDIVLYGGAASKTLTADTVGRWTVTLEATICAEYRSTQVLFDVAPDTYDVSISTSGTGPQASINIQVDGQSQGTMAGSEIKKLTFKVDTTHTIAIDQYVQGDPGVRYFCSQNTLTVGSVGSHTFEYETQYMFTTGTDPEGVAQVSGGGWFKAGSTVQTNQPPDTVAGPADTQYVFKGWELDGAPQTGKQISLTLDKPHKAIAKYTTQYRLVVDSAGGLGDPKGSGFYDAGSTADFSVTSPVGLLVQQVFVRWEGDYSGTSTRASITMDKPKVVHAQWTTSYIQLYIVLGALAAVLVIAVILLRRRRQAAGAPTMKPTPPMTGEAVGPPPEVSGGSLKCDSCGADVPQGQTFCHNCGARMSSSR